MRRYIVTIRYKSLHFGYKINSQLIKKAFMHNCNCRHFKDKEFNEEDCKSALKIYDLMYYIEQIIFLKVENQILFKKYIQRIQKKENFKKIIHVDFLEENKVRCKLTGLKENI